MLKVKPFRQSPGYCGPAALKMVLEYFGVHRSEKELAKLSGCTKQKGVEADGLIKAAKAFGFEGFFKDFAAFVDIEKYVLKKKIPVIVDWFSTDDGHYSVVVGINKKNIYLQDPETAGIRKFGLEAFKRVWFDFPGKRLVSRKDLILRRMIVIEISG